MPRYFFNIDGNDLPDPDEEGTELAGPEQARSAVVALAGELLTEAEGRFWSRPAWRFCVTDEQGVPVCELAITGSATGSAGGDQRGEA